MWIVLVLLIFLLPVKVAAESAPFQAAFIRDQGLWLYNGEDEVLLQENISISDLSWSHDGQWLAFETSKENVLDSDIWLYHVPTNKHLKLKVQGRSLIWNPKEQSFAFLTDSFLSVVELSSMKPVIHQLTGGVSHFSWDAEGENLLASASAMLFPDGWSHPRLYMVNWMLEKKKQELDVKVDPLYTIPSPLTLDEELSIASIDAEHFSWSKDGKFMALIVSPTASWSADSNMLSVFVHENKLFIPMGEILRKKEWIKWAPTKPVLASIQGGGRLTTGVKNKKLTVQRILPNQKKTFTPKSYADIDFDWIDDETIVVARGLESEKPASFYSSLYMVNLKEDSTPHPKLIETPDGSSDENPIFLKSRNQISWIRKDSNGWNTVWISNLDGSKKRKLIDGVDKVVWYK